MNPHVTSIVGLARHVTRHRRRVYQLALFLAPEMGLGGRLLVRMHDVEKYVVLPMLWAFYGGKGNRRLARWCYDRMNQLGRVLVTGIKPFANSGVPRIEHTADVVDRHCDPVTLEEFSLSAQRPITDFLCAEDVPLAEKAIAAYGIITGGGVLKLT